MFRAEKIAQDKKNILKEFERDKKTISETQAKGVAKLILADTKRNKATIKMTGGREIPPRPAVPIPERTDMRTLGQINHHVRALDE